MKIKVLILTLILSIVLIGGCTPKETPAPAPDPIPEAPSSEDLDTEGPDVVTTPSIATNEDELQTAMSDKGTWIIILQEDMTTDKDLVLEGEFTNRDVIARKIALYAQDAERKKTATYTLTAPKLTVRSENARIQGGTFVGDVFVEANGFAVVDAKVQGNVTFASEEFKSSFVTEDDGTVTGTTEVKK